jgi:hypothetical protein
MTVAPNLMRLLFTKRASSLHITCPLKPGSACADKHPKTVRLSPCRMNSPYLKSPSSGIENLSRHAWHEASKNCTECEVAIIAPSVASHLPPPERRAEPNKIFEISHVAERKARAAVRCRRLVKPAHRRISVVQA